MQLNVNLPVEIEAALRRRATSVDQDVDTFVSNVVIEELADEVPPKRSRRVTPEEFERRTSEWIKLHPVLDHPIDDSRESFYEGRGE